MRLLLLLGVAVLAVGCSVDRVEWESTGYAVDAARHYLEEHHVEATGLECIQREAQGALWECRAHADGEELECRVHFQIRQKLKSIHCEPHGEEAPPRSTER